jgi:hypothetical protein
MSWISSLFSGNKATLGAEDTLSSTGGSSIGAGQNLTGAAGSFYNTLLSGDMGAITKLLSPQIGAIQKQTQQKKQAASQFGNRSGGTNASMQAADDTARGSINDLVSGLTSSAASGAASLGTGLLGIGTSATANAGDLALKREQLQNQMMAQVGQGIGALITA